MEKRKFGAKMELNSKKSFKQFLNEWSDHELSYLIAQGAIPLDPGMMKRLGYYQEKVQAYHLTNKFHLENTIENQNKRQTHLSCFTKGGPELARLPSQPNVLLLLEGDSVIEGKTDIWTTVSWRGKRWLDIRGRKGAEKLEFYVKGVLQKLSDQWEFGIDVYKQSPGYLEDEIDKLSKSESIVFYKQYLTEMERMLNRNYKTLNKYLKTAAEMKYNEIVLTKWKILQAWCVDYDRPDIIIILEKNKIPYSGVIKTGDFSKLSI